MPNEEVDVSEAPTKKQNTGGKNKGKKVATTSVENNDIKSMPTEVMSSIPPNTVLVPGDGKGSLSLIAEGIGSQGQKKADKKKKQSELRSYILVMMDYRIFKPKFLLRNPLECQNRH